MTIREDHVTVAEAAKMMNRSTPLVNRLCREGRFPGAVKMGNSWIIPREAVLNHKPLPPGVKPKARCIAAEKAAILEKAVTQVKEPS